MKLEAWLARHAQTLVGSLGRIVQHPVGAVSTMAVIGVALALPLLLDVFLQNSDAATANWNQAFDISVYLDKKAASSRAPALAKQLRARPDVAAVRIITAEEALAQFRAASGFGAALDALSDNPLPDTLVVTPALSASTPDGTLTLKQAVASLADVQTVQIDTDWVNRLYALLDILRRIVWLTAGLLGVGVILVVGITIRLDILKRRAEIEVIIFHLFDPAELRFPFDRLTQFVDMETSERLQVEPKYVREEYVRQVREELAGY